ncbi:MAG TPA: hypothetical protein VGR78_15245, partial [Verrucomicrobiae bacterium]|nr:hypothetical protein [Verrucomicrobiae bacterium]
PPGPAPMTTTSVLIASIFKSKPAVIVPEERWNVHEAVKLRGLVRKERRDALKKTFIAKILLF